MPEENLNDVYDGNVWKEFKVGMGNHFYVSHIVLGLQSI